jgi:hypothetical protein
MTTSGGIDSGIPNRSKSPLLVTAVPVSVLQGLSGRLLAATDAGTVGLSHPLSLGPDLLMPAVGGRTSFNSHLDPQLPLNVSGLFAN